MAIEGLNPYIDYGTRTLYNDLGITSPAELQRVEGELASQRLTELQLKPIQGSFDFEHLKAIHQHVFQDTYKWAGHARENFDAAKQEYIGGPVHRFTPSAAIEKEAAKVFGRLAQDKHLTGLHLDRFIEKAAALHNEINQIHAFPEGNGRAQREFLREVSVQAGHPIDLRGATQERIMEASIAGTNGDNKPMERLLAEATDPQRVQSLLTALEAIEKHRGPEQAQAAYMPPQRQAKNTPALSWDAQ